ncbi:hypothetical protein FRB91_002582 [Serendipita sp. 411]|nr:hypothetical protein FRB91_002582 [Serendipita sp. 411]
MHNIFAQLRPVVFSADESGSLRLAKMTSGGVIVVELEDAQAEISSSRSRIRDIYTFVMEKETGVADSPAFVLRASAKLIL